MIVPVIIAGGSGTRLWPLSRKLNPKQFLRLVDDKSLLQATLHRLDGIADVGQPILLCNEEHRFLAAEQCREAGSRPMAIILEPQGRNTAPAIALAAIRLLEEGQDPALLVLPADHYIADVAAFQRSVAAGLPFARAGRLVTFGIVPDAPETGYGYIEQGDTLLQEGVEGFAIRRFVEKPDRETAERYVSSGRFYWNSGMFLFTAGAYLAELEKFAPEMVRACRAALAGGSKDIDFYRLDADAFLSCPEDSIDYAVMEKTDKGVMIPMDAGWNDVGSWEALWKISAKDKDSNVRIGDVVTHDVSNSYLQSSGKLLAVIGLKDHVVVETKDAVMVSPRNRVQEVKKLVDKLKAANRGETDVHAKVYRPWGSYESIDIEDRFQVKRITVKPGAKLSLQKHFHRSEHWIVVKGTAVVTCGDKQLVLKEDESTYIPLGCIHRLENPGRIPLELIEVQTGSYLGEDDIVRTDDVYGRSAS